MTTTRKFGVSILTVVNCLALVCFLSVSHEHAILEANVKQLVGKESCLRRLERAVKEARDECLSLEALLYAYDLQLLEMLGDCSSREDFVVRGGPRIALKTYRLAEDSGFRSIFYLPPGRHVVRVAVVTSADVWGADSSEQKRLLFGTPSPDMCVNELSVDDSPGVYQLDVSARADGKLYFQFHEPSGVRSNETSVKFTDYLTLDAEPGVKLQRVCYPSEFVLDRTADRFFRYGNVKPSTTLLALRALGRRATVATVRVWVESVAPTCLPAHKLAAGYDLFDELRNRSQLPGTTAIERLDKPTGDSNLYTLEIR